MESAERLFSEKGFNGTSVRDIAEAADVNLAMISYYFGSKEKLMEALFAYRAQGTRIQLQSLVDNKEMPSMDKIHHLIDYYLDKFQKNQCFHRIMAREQVVHTSGHVSNLILNLKKTNLELVKLLIQEGQRRGQFKKNIDITLVMSSMIGTVNHVLTTQHYYKELTGQQTLSDEQFEKYMRKKLSTYLKSIYKAILTDED